MASAALDRPAARRRDVLAWAGGEARSQAADGADGRRHGPRGHDCGGSSAALRGGGAAGGCSGGGGDGRIRSAGDGARLAVAACCASAEFHDRVAACANSPSLVGCGLGAAAPRHSSRAASSDGNGGDDGDGGGSGHSSSSDNRRVGCSAASAASSTGPATKLALNARGWVWAWCGCFSVDCCLPPPVQQLDVFRCR